MADYMKKAAKSAADYNLHFQRERRDERCAYFDLQTFVRCYTCHSFYCIFILCIIYFCMQISFLCPCNYLQYIYTYRIFQCNIEAKARSLYKMARFSTLILVVFCLSNKYL